MILSLFAATIAAHGQDENTEEKLKIDVGADLISSYVWRGWYLAGPSIQPELSISAYGFTLGTWGSKDFSTFEKEIDFYFSFEFKGFSVRVSDYWMMYEDAPYFKNKGNHLIEAGLGYTFPEKFPLSLEVNTLILGNEDVCEEDGRQYYSTYISLSFPFSIKDIKIETGIGISPFKGMYSSKLDVVTATVKATKELQLSTNYALPVYTELIVSPTQNNIFLVFGINF